MPNSMLDALKDVAQEEHCLDVSEAIRSILRRRMSAKPMTPKQSMELLGQRRKLAKKLADLADELRELGDKDA